MYDLNRVAEVYRLQHKHDDGTWVEMRAHPSPARDDPDRLLAEGAIAFECTQCQESAVVIPGASGPEIPPPG